ncbi:hypothetical protein GCM10010207_65350 [Streptomyces atratus]|uniref:hypothetical protein n=1 Tax=Streptomyces atratus TaxID=1893 RepID=UPI00166FC058|nr:hypothetical protein [Streptomyces atratus]GGT56367.1 hypothetical protein GCM10010207_65350 [Streptomyces atratus]
MPTVSNTGCPFSVRHHRQWDAMVKQLAGGMTLIQLIRGSWVDPVSQEDFAERMIPVRIMCTSEQIVGICKETARFYDEFSVLATLVATEPVLVKPPARQQARFIELTGGKTCPALITTSTGRRPRSAGPTTCARNPCRSPCAPSGFTVSTTRRLSFLKAVLAIRSRAAAGSLPRMCPASTRTCRTSPRICTAP